MKRYYSYMCLTFDGIRDGGEYRVHKIVESSGHYKFQASLMILQQTFDFSVMVEMLNF